jgi:uncharacterized protein YgiM (DUF1202 family)
MKTKSLNLLLTGLIGLVLSLLISACTTPSDEVGQVTGPVASITSPESGSTLTQGQEILITFNAADVKGVAQVELTIDGEAVMVEQVNPPVNSYTASYRWSIDTAGNRVIELQAFNVNREASEASRISVTVVEPEGTVEATSTLTLTDAPTVATIVDTPTSPPPSPDTPTPVPSPTEPAAAIGAEPTITMLTGLNVRSGPSTNYPVIGRLAQGETARITGRDELATWWQIEFNSAQGNRGWVSGGSQYSAAANTQGVPVVPAPPLDVAAAPTPTPAPPTPTSSPLRPTIYSFTADRYTIARGERVTLRWDLANANAAFLRYDDEEEGIVSPGSKTVSPEEDTKYTLVARNNAGETTAELTIQVSGSAPTPVPVWRDGEIRIADGQGVDFDEGLILDESDDEVDFRWDGGSQRFVPRNGAAGTLLGENYNDITLEDCLTAEYNRPISGIDGSSRVTGCYITNEDRYGRFFVSEWDLAANLTIEWLTWDYED